MQTSGRSRSDRLDQPERIVDRVDDLVPLVGEEMSEALAEQHSVLGDHDAHGIST